MPLVLSSAIMKQCYPIVESEYSLETLFPTFLMKCCRNNSSVNKKKSKKGFVKVSQLLWKKFHFWPVNVTLFKHVKRKTKFFKIHFLIQHWKGWPKEGARVFNFLPTTFFVCWQLCMCEIFLQSFGELSPKKKRKNNINIIIN